jgi:hypothetical protein
MANKVNFSVQTRRKVPTKQMPAKYQESPLRPNIEVSDGVRPHFPLIPLRYLDVKYQDITTDRWVVIPKGRLVSAVTVANTMYLGQLDQTETPPDTALSVPEDSYFAYTTDVMGLMVPCNGGTARTITYDADDVAAEVADASPAAGKALVAVADTYSLPANAPIGVAMYDVYQDIRGQYLNFEDYRNYGVLAEQLIKIPYVDFGELRGESAAYNFVNYTAATNSGYRVSGAAALSATEDAGYIAAEKHYSFLYFDSAEDATAGLSGQLLRSDDFGNWIPEGVVGGDPAGGSVSLSSNRTGQTAGRLVGLDNRYPKDLLDTVEQSWRTLGGFRPEGTPTNGMPANLFDFADKALSASGVAYTNDKVKHIQAMLEAGVFGYAIIQLTTR